MLGVFITLSSLCLNFRWIHSSVWPQSTWGTSQKTFLRICSLGMGTCNDHTITIQPATFLTSNLSAGMETLFTIFAWNSTLCFYYPAHFTPVLALFIAYVYDHQYAPSTVSTYFSALGYWHKLSGFPDPSKAFFIVQMLKGYGKLGSCLFSRLPITLPILNTILGSSPVICHTPYDRYLFQAMCSLACFACIWVGEFTWTTSRERGSLILLHQLTQLVDVNQKVISLKFTFLDFKHNYNQRPFSVVTVLCKSNANVFRRNSRLFLAFRRKNIEFSMDANFQRKVTIIRGAYCSLLCEFSKFVWNEQWLRIFERKSALFDKWLRA